MKSSNIKFAIGLFIGAVAFVQSLKAVDFSWQHDDTSNTTKYVLYEVVGDIDPSGERLPTDDDKPVGEVPVGQLQMQDVRIKPATSYYVRAENTFFRSGNSNTVDIPPMPKGIIELKVTVNLNLNLEN